MQLSMTGSGILTLLLTCLAAIPVSSPASALDVPPGGSPRLAALAHDLEAGNRDALAAFWTEVKGQVPLVEPIPGDDGHRTVTFLWRGDDPPTSVLLLGGFASPNLTKPLARLKDTDLWYLTETHPADARFQYLFMVNEPLTQPRNMSELMLAMQQGQPRPDPLNEKVFAGQPYVELPDAPPQPWIQVKSDVPHGKLSQQKFKSGTLKAEYPITIYTPPGYDKLPGRCGLMVAFDGGFPMMEVTLDNLIAAGKIPPVVVVGVGNLSQQTRNRDLSGSEAFATFLSNELVPWARKTYRVSPDASHTIVGGISLGGYMAVYCGLKQSKTFGKVLALSPTLILEPGHEEASDFWNPESPALLARQFAASPRLPVQFHLEVGRYENFYLVSLLAQARRLRDVLEAKGYRLGYAEFDGGHNAVCWRGSFAEGMMELMPVESRGDSIQKIKPAKHPDRQPKDL